MILSFALIKEAICLEAVSKQLCVILAYMSINLIDLL